MVKNENWIVRHFYIIVGIYAGVIFVGNDIYLPAMHDFAKYFSVDIKYSQYAVTAYVFGIVSLQWIIGPFSDSFGRKLPMYIFGAFTIVGCIGCYFATDIRLFYFFRVLQGIAGGVVGSAGLASIFDYYKGHKLTFALSITSNVFLAAPALGPALGAYLLLIMNWKELFLLVCFLLILALILVYFFMPETLPKEHRHDYQSVKHILKLFLAVAKDKLFLLYCIPNMITTICFVMWIANGPVMLMNNFHMSALEYGNVSIIPFIFMIIANFLTSSVVKKIGVRKLLFIMHILLIFSASLFLAVGYLFPNNIYLFISSLSIIFGVLGFLNSPRNQFAMSLSLKLKGTASSLYTILRTLTGVTTTIISANISSYMNIVPISIMGIACISSALTGEFAHAIIKKRRPNLQEL